MNSKEQKKITKRKAVVDKRNKEKSSITNPKSSINNGYTILISVLIIGAVGFSIVTSLTLLGIGSSRSSLLIEQSNQAKALANACVEEALQQIWDNDAYVGTNALALGQGECSYEVLSATIPKTITASGTVGTVVRKVSISIDQISPSLNIASWQEVAD